MEIPEKKLPYFEEICKLIIEQNYRSAIKFILKLAQNNEWDDKSTSKWLGMAFKGYVMNIESEALKLQNEEDFIKATEKCKEVQELIVGNLDLLGIDKKGFATVATEFVMNLPPQINFDYTRDALNTLLESKKTALDANTLFWLKNYLLMHVFPEFYKGVKKK